MGVTRRSSYPHLVRWSASFGAAVLVVAGVVVSSPAAVARSAPAVTKVAPRTGTTGGRTRVTITGHGFRHVTKVKFGRTAGARLRVVSTRKLLVTTPRHSAGRVNVRVVTTGGTSAVVAADTFRFVAPPAQHPASGSYTGLDHANRALSFFVNASGTEVQDISVPIVDLSCVPAGSTSDSIQIASIPISQTGSFSSMTTQDGVFNGHPAHFTYTFQGNFTGTTAGGQLRETVATTDVPSTTCTSNGLSWSVTREVQPAQPTTPPPPGSYSGLDNANRALSLFVNASGTELQDVSVPIVDLQCLPAGNAFDNIQIASIPIKPDGSFSSTTTQSGILSGHPQTFTYTFRGHVHGLTPTGLWRLAGQLRESIDSDDLPARNCTSDDQAWSVRRDVQPGQPSTPPAAGSYTGLDVRNRALSLTVDASGSTLQNVSVPIVDLACLPASSAFDSIQIASISLHPDGSFTSTTHSSGVFGGHPANFTFVFNGHVHGLAPNGQSRLAGQLRESIETTDVPTQSCTSNDLEWLVIHS